MLISRTTALAAASALIISGCATTAWQRPPHHPADPGADSGVTTAITVLDRYRDASASEACTPPVETPHPKPTDKTMHHHDQGEAQP